MKRFLSLLLAVGMVLSLAACGSSADDTSEETEETEETTEETDEESEETEETETEEEETEETEETEEDEEESSDDEEDSDEPVYGGSISCYFSNEFSNVYDASNAGLGTSSFYTDYLWNIDWDVDRDEMDYGSSYINSDYMVGSLAESWEIADDYSSITVTIRDDVYFQDKVEAGFDEEYDIYGGRQLTAEDVKYSYDRLLGLDGVEMVEFDMADWESTLSMLDSVEVVDDYTVTFYLNTTDEISVSDFMCAFVGICGSEWDDLTDEEKANWKYASGTGAFILTNYVNDNTMTFERNPNYWATDSDGNQLPYLDEVNLICMTDSATLLASFISGEIDIIVANQTMFDSDQVTQLEAALDEDDYVQYIYTGDYNSLGLKQGDNPNEALTDVNVRTAMQYALDVATLSEFAGYTYESTEQMLSGVWGSGTVWCDTSSWSDELYESYTTYDPDYALELLEEAGYADGFTFEVALGTENDTDLYSLAAEYLAEVGITVDFNVVTTGSELQSIGKDSTDSQSIPYGLCAFTMDSLNMALGNSDCVFANNDEIDALVEELFAAETMDEQIELAKELDQTYMAEHYLLLITYNKVDSRWARSRVQGYSGEDLTKNCYYGYTLARLWVNDAE